MADFINIKGMTEEEAFDAVMKEVRARHGYEIGRAETSEEFPEMDKLSAYRALTRVFETITSIVREEENLNTVTAGMMSMACLVDYAMQCGFDRIDIIGMIKAVSIEMEASLNEKDEYIQ